MADNRCKECSFCCRSTKYSCVSCAKPVCNRSSECSTPAEEHLQKEFESVSYCRDCKTLDVNESTKETGKRCISPFDSTEDGDDGDDSDSMSEIRNAATTRKKRKRGKKCQWEPEDLDDFVDIIINDENHQRKLIFQNTMSKTNKSNYENIQKELKSRAEKRGSVFDKSVTQMRNKFKKLVSECKKANMVFKTATGISNYKDEKNYSKWFDMLFPLIKSRESCQPEQAIEPSAGQATSDKESGINVFDADLDESETSKNSDDKLFIPKPTKKNKTGQNMLVEKTTEVLESVKSLLENQQTTTLLEFMEKENARARAHELEVLKLLIPPVQTQLQSNFDTPMSSVPQGWQPYGPVSTSPPVASSFGQQHRNSFPVNPVRGGNPSNIPSRALSNPQATYSQHSGEQALGESTEYFKL